MENNAKNKRTIRYSKGKACLYGGLSAISILLIFALQPLFYFWAALFLIFTVCMSVQAVKLSRVGCFEEIAVSENGIAYSTEKSGVLTLERQDIEDIRIREWFYKGTTRYEVKILIRGREKPLTVNAGFPDYEKLVGEIRNFWQK